MATQEFKDLLISGKLPTPPGVGMRILELTRTEDFSIAQMGDIIRADSALTGRILKLANSASVSGSQPATTVQESIMRLGSSTVRDLALAFSLVAERRESACRAFDFDRYWSKCLARAVAAQAIGAEVSYSNPQEAYVAGLLGEIGRLALAHIYPEAYSEFIDEGLLHDPKTLMQRESQAFGIDHAELAADMSEEWGLPQGFVGAVRAFMRTPTRLPDRETPWDLTRVLRHAEVLGSLMVSGSHTPLGSWERYRAGLDQLLAELGREEPEIATLFGHGVREWISWGREMNIPVESKVTFAKVRDSMAEALQEDDNPEPPVPSRPSASQAAPAASTKAAPPQPTPEKITILAVDDEPMQRRLISKYLLQAGYEVLTAKDGKEALSMALERVPDIVVADYLMPNIDGLDLCRALRKTDVGSRMYYLIVTGRDDPEALVDAFESGVDDFLTKPFIPRLLHARIKGGVRLVRLQRKVEADRRVMERQMAELSVLTRKLRNAAMTDALTGLPNRRYAMKRLEGEWAFSKRSDRPLCLIMVDIDHFKSVNDRYGHDVGDVVLTHTAKTLKDGVRESDEACRLGGEEFLIICRNTDEAGGELVAERLRANVEASLISMGNTDRNVTISLGVACTSGDYDGIDALLKGADLAVYEAKDKGRNRFELASRLQGEDDQSDGLRESA